MISAMMGITYITMLYIAFLTKDEDPHFYGSMMNITNLIFRIILCLVGVVIVGVGVLILFAPATIVADVVISVGYVLVFVVNIIAYVYEDRAWDEECKQNGTYKKFR